MVAHKQAGKDAAMATVLSEPDSWHGRDVFAVLSTVIDLHIPIPKNLRSPSSIEFG